jgi:hypothetical protein
MLGGTSLGSSFTPSRKKARPLTFVASTSPSTVLASPSSTGVSYLSRCLATHSMLVVHQLRCVTFTGRVVERSASRGVERELSPVGTEAVRRSAPERHETSAVQTRGVKCSTDEPAVVRSASASLASLVSTRWPRLATSAQPRVMTRVVYPIYCVFPCGPVVPLRQSPVCGARPGRPNPEFLEALGRLGLARALTGSWRGGRRGRGGVAALRRSECAAAERRRAAALHGVTRRVRETMVAVRRRAAHGALVRRPHGLGQRHRAHGLHPAVLLLR